MKHPRSTIAIGMQLPCGPSAIAEIPACQALAEPAIPAHPDFAQARRFGAERLEAADFDSGPPRGLQLAAIARKSGVGPERNPRLNPILEI